MTDETPVEGEAFDVPEVQAEEKPAAKPKRVRKAKSLIDEEAERKAEEAKRARTVSRAAPLMESAPDAKAGDPNRMVECIVLSRGEGRIHTGETDPKTGYALQTCYAQGEKFSVTEEAALKLELKGFAAIVSK